MTVAYMVQVDEPEEANEHFWANAGVYMHLKDAVNRVAEMLDEGIHSANDLRIIQLSPSGMRWDFKSRYDEGITSPMRSWGGKASDGGMVVPKDHQPTIMPCASKAAWEDAK